MAVRQVLLIGNHILREQSRDIDFEADEISRCLGDLRDTLHYLRKTKKIGRALAAPQIGVLKKIIYMEGREPGGKAIVMINPRITARSPETFTVWDSCFSAEVAFFGKTLRHRAISVEYFDEDQNRIVADFRDDRSELFQHEIDHLEGILFTDRVLDNQIIMRAEYEKLQ
jgi:peptide deformylase